MGVEKLNHALGFLNTIEPIPLKTVLSTFEKNSELEMICYRLLTFYEGLVRGIRQGVYDEEVIKIARYQTMIRTYESFKLY